MAILLCEMQNRAKRGMYFVHVISILGKEYGISTQVRKSSN